MYQNILINANTCTGADEWADVIVLYVAFQKINLELQCNKKMFFRYNSI